MGISIECLEQAWATWFIFLLCAAVVFVIVMFMIWKNVTGERTEKTIVLKILINYAQTLSFVGGMNYIKKHRQSPFDFL